MEFMLILLADREAPEDPSLYPEMGRFAPLSVTSLQWRPKAKRRGRYQQIF